MGQRENKKENRLYARKKKNTINEVMTNIKKAFLLSEDLYSASCIDDLKVYANIPDTQMKSITRNCCFMTLHLMKMIKARKVPDKDLDRLLNKEQDSEEIVIDAYSTGIIDSILAHIIAMTIEEIGCPDDPLWKAPIVSAIIGGMDKYRASRANGVPDTTFYNVWTFVFTKLMVDFIGLCQVEVTFSLVL